MSTVITATLDTRGLFCPEPVMMLHDTMRDLPEGAVVEMLATDPSTLRDVVKFCRFLDHQLLEQQDDNGEYRYVIQKANQNE